MENKVGTTTVSKYDYTNDTIGRRTGVQKSGTAFTATDTIAWGYDNRSQVTSAVAATDATYDYTYAYDPIGNRTSSVTKETGTPVTTGYTSSQLNQYTAITGRTDPTYDDDGNMTLLPAAASDWTLAWDGENRLASAESAIKRLEFVYDHMDRRIERRTYDGAPGDWTLAETRRFLYDGWHLVAEFDHQSGVNTLKCTHLWGLDLSQSVGGAGGVGGLLRTTLYPTSPIGGGWAQGQRYYPTYDGNGNVSEYLDAAAAIAARHQYSPFGRLTVSTGLALPFRFSTKYLDADTSLYYYGYRYYTPELGRWLSRDPIGERGGQNLVGMVANSPLAAVDSFGLRDFHQGRGGRPPEIPNGARKTDVSHWGAMTFHVWLYEFYVSRPYRHLAHYPKHEYVIIGGDFLEKVKKQSQQLSLNKRVEHTLNANATIMTKDIACGQEGKFENHDKNGILSDKVGNLSVALSLQRYTVWWEASCSIGPKKCERCEDDPGCTKETTPYTCNVYWTLRDTYDFDVVWNEGGARAFGNLAWFVFGWEGIPFEIDGSWHTQYSGTVVRRRTTGK